MLRALPIFGPDLQAILSVLGVLAAFAMVERLAVRLGLSPKPINTAALLGLATLFLAERLLLLAVNWQFARLHPLWFAGLLSVTDPRVVFAADALAIAAAAVFLLARRISLARASAVLVPATLLLLAFVDAGNFAAGAEPGRPTHAGWGVVCSSGWAHALYGTPLHVRLFPVAAMLSAGCALLAFAGALAATLRGNMVGFLLFAAGLLTVIAGQMRMTVPGEPRLLGVFTWNQCAGICSASVGAVLLLCGEGKQQRQNRLRG